MIPAGVGAGTVSRCRGGGARRRGNGRSRCSTQTLLYHWDAHDVTLVRLRWERLRFQTLFVIEIPDTHDVT